VEWWERELRRLGVTLHLETQASAASILQPQPDAVMLATGARFSPSGRSAYLDQAIPGHQKAIVCRPEDILLGNVRPSGKVVVLDSEGGHAGVGVAEVLALRGAEVEILTPYFSPMSVRLADGQDAHFIAKRLLAAGVKLSPLNYLKAIGDRVVTAYNVYTEREHQIEGVDFVVLATAREPVNDLECALDGKVRQLFTVGDALAPRAWTTASFEGQKFARLIGEPSAPGSVTDLYFSSNDPIFDPLPA
jgi:hypothetical protein